MSAARAGGRARLRRAVPAVVAGLASVAALAGGTAAQANAAAVTHAAAARAAASGGTWGKAAEVPGITALAVDGTSTPLSVSCASAGNCSAGGYYTKFASEPGPQEPFVVDEQGGTWGKAEQVPGTVALNQGGVAQLTSVSCASAGNCSAGGFYTDGNGNQQAFVAGQTNGTWGKAEVAPGTAARNRGGFAGVTSVSCPSPGNCSAGGYFTGGSAKQQAFVISQKDGTWSKMAEVPGTAALNQGGVAQLTSVSCASAGNCGAGGYYTVRSGRQQAFVVSETNGTWGTAEQVPGTAALNRGGVAQVSSVSCPAAGNCGAGGSYDPDNSGHDQGAFVVSEKGGTWRAAIKVPGMAALNKGRFAAVDQVSCASAGNCGAGGFYTDGFGHQQPFVVSDKGGTWATAEQVPGTAALSKGAAQLTSVSCASAGNCSAGGSYTDGNGNQQAFVAGETGGTWRPAKEVPGFSALNKGGTAGVDQVSCTSAEHCSAAGIYQTSNGFTEVFVVGET
jgi:hypothetical protein